jgi:hypothetical protein
MKQVPDGIPISQLTIDGFNTRLDFSHHPGVMIEAYIVDAAHEIIPLGI